MSTEASKDRVKRKAGWVLLAGLMLGLSRPCVAEQGPVEVLQTMTDTLVDIVTRDPDVIQDKGRLRAIAHEVVLSRVDFNGLSRWVLGKYWRTATPQQRTAFIAEFREMLLGSYLRSVTAYEGNVVRFLPLRGEQKKGRAIVNAEVEQPDGPDINVSFRMRRVMNQWLIYDVTVEGISLVATHRTSFSREIRDSGLDNLIAQLRARNVSSAVE